MAKKIAMVQPKPQGPSGPPSLEQILERLGNDRAYTVISHKGSTWVVHFEGDAAPITITADTK
jgi:hypothetical protein